MFIFKNNASKLNQSLEKALGTNMVSGCRYELPSGELDSFDMHPRDVVFRANMYARFLKYAYKLLAIKREDRNLIELFCSSGVLSMLLADQTAGSHKKQDPGKIIRRAIGVSNHQSNIDFANDLAKNVGTYKHCRYIKGDPENVNLMEDVIIHNNIHFMIHNCLDGLVCRNKGVIKSLDGIGQLSSNLKGAIMEMNWSSAHMKYYRIESMEDLANLIVENTDYTHWYYISSVGISGKDIIGFLKLKSYIQDK